MTLRRSKTFLDFVKFLRLASFSAVVIDYTYLQESQVRQNLDLGADTGASPRGTRKVGVARKRRGNERARFIIRDADTLRLSPEVVLREGWRRHGVRGECRVRGRGRTEGRVRCKWEAGAEGTAWINTITRGWLTTRSPWQRGWEATRDNHPFACHRNYTLPTLDLVYHADFLPSSFIAQSVLLVFPSLDMFQIFASRRILIYIKMSNPVSKLETK